MDTPDTILGKTLQTLRESKGVTRLTLAGIINETEQQIAKFEKGAMVPLTTLEAIAETLGEALPKRIIRRISFLRKLGQEKGVIQPELVQIYETLFQEE